MPRAKIVLIENTYIDGVKHDAGECLGMELAKAWKLRDSGNAVMYGDFKESMLANRRTAMLETPNNRAETVRKGRGRPRKEVADASNNHNTANR